MLVATDEPASLNVDCVTYMNEANLEINKYLINTTQVDSKSKCTYMFRLALSHPQAQQDYVKRKCKLMCVMLLKKRLQCVVVGVFIFHFYIIFTAYKFLWKRQSIIITFIIQGYS